MIDKFVRKVNLNVYTMLRHGSVAVVTLFLVAILFGTKNVMLAFPIALTSTVMSRQNFHVKTFSKALRIILVDLAIVVTAHISSLNLYIGIPINFMAIFLIMYTIVSPYDLTFYKPFIMLYVFTQYAAVPTSQLPLRLLSVILGIAIVVSASAIKKTNEKSVLGNSIVRAFTYIKEQLDNLESEKYNVELEKECSMLMRDIAYNVYITRHKGYLTTNLGKVQFQLFLSIEYLNIELGNIKKENIQVIKKVIENLIDYGSGKITLGCAKNIIYSCDKNINIEEIEILKIIIENIEELEKLGIKEINKVYSQWERGDIDKPKKVFKEHFRRDSIRFKFAMRMSITLTISLFLGEYLGYYKIIWAIITIMSIMQPYYEDTVHKAKDRLLGNVIAIVFTGILINLINRKSITIIVLIMALYLLYGFKEYYKISLFAGISSICISSLNQNINVLIFYRILYVIFGVALVMLVNKYVLPYRLKDGIEALVHKILKLNCRLVNTTEKYLRQGENINEIRDIVIHSTLLGQKLYFRNLQYNDEGISKFIDNNNNFIITAGYKALLNKDNGELIMDLIKKKYEQLINNMV